IVEPMSVQALIDTVAVELNQRFALGRRKIAIAPGNFGLDFMKARFGFDLDRAVKCSNFFGQAVDLAAEKGFSALLVCGHVGKLVKVAGGIMNTHSRESDARLEIMAASAVACGAPLETARAVLGANTTDAALELVEPAELRAAVMARIAERAAFYLRKRAGDALQIETVVFANKSDAVGATDGARALVDAIIEDSEDE
ncbi:MAG: cobalt-precorrin-5B (C(1))-methyltransferase, partial [Thermoguttaceae bacterium]|nr:cobalt-precorrin-5B (C(1))-methyltransferase [Thermoguttaceae bacterium]